MKTLIILSFIIPISFLFPKIQQLPSTNDVIEAPVLLQPSLHQYVADSTINLMWSSTHPNHVYEIYLADNAAFQNGIRKASIDTILTFDLLTFKNKTVFWKVRAFKNKKHFSVWSDVSSFYYLTDIQPVDTQIINSRSCHGNCANCPNPCGRKRSYEESPDLN